MPGITDSRTRDDLSPAGTARENPTTHGAGAPDGSPADERADGGAGTVRLLDADGVRHPSPEHDRWLTDVDGDDRALLRLLEDMVVVRRVDAEATALQRQGELALWPPLLGQEAAQVGSAHALRRDDFVFSSYREHGVAYVRGVAPVDLVRGWRGVVTAGWDPYAVNMATPQIIVGGHALHGVGYAMGILADADRDDTAGRDEGTAAVVSYFGDGAMSQGAVNEAFVFAATWSAPVVFFCQNNQWAISEPVAVQSPVPLVARAAGFGLTGVQVDGNDVLGVLAVTRAALHRARTGGGPTLVEAVTYRRGPHTTADDPTRYRETAEVEAWVRRDPVDRFTAYLRDRGVLTDAADAHVHDVADQVAAALRAGLVAIPTPPPLAIFEHVYAQPNPALAAERDAYARYLAGFADDVAGGAR